MGAGLCHPCPFITQAPRSKSTLIQTRHGSARVCPIQHLDCTRCTLVISFFSGGKLPPVNCPSGLLRSEDGAECVCKPGSYANTPTTCKLCEPGYKCAGGVRVQCPIHYYQSASGATECLACNSLGTRQGFYRCTVRGQLLKFCNPAVNGTQDRPLQTNCISCNQCRRAYANIEDDVLTECYRDN